MKVRAFPSVPSVRRGFNRGGCWTLSDAFSASSDMIMCCFGFSLSVLIEF